MVSHHTRQFRGSQARDHRPDRVESRIGRREDGDFAFGVDGVYQPGTGKRPLRGGEVGVDEGVGDIRGDCKHVVDDMNRPAREIKIPRLNGCDVAIAGDERDAPVVWERYAGNALTARDVGERSVVHHGDDDGSSVGGVRRWVGEVGGVPHALEDVVFEEGGDHARLGGHGAHYGVVGGQLVEGCVGRCEDGDVTGCGKFSEEGFLAGEEVVQDGEGVVVFVEDSGEGLAGDEGRAACED